jgi:acyl carrier protein
VRRTVTADEAMAVLAAALGDVAPDVAVSDIDPRKLLQEETDIDSVDFINLVEAIHDRCGIEIPERDYAELATVEGIVDYLTSHAG